MYNINCYNTIQIDLYIYNRRKTTHFDDLLKSFLNAAAELYLPTR